MMGADTVRNAVFLVLQAHTWIFLVVGQPVPIYALSAIWASIQNFPLRMMLSTASIALQENTPPRLVPRQYFSVWTVLLASTLARQQ